MSERQLLAKKLPQAIWRLRRRGALSDEGEGKGCQRQAFPARESLRDEAERRARTLNPPRRGEREEKLPVETGSFLVRSQGLEPWAC